MTYDTSYRADETVKKYGLAGNNMSSDGTAAVRGLNNRGFVGVGAKQANRNTQYFSGVAGVSGNTADRLRGHAEPHGGAGRVRTGEASASGELRRRRSVSRTPDMSSPHARREAPSVSLGAVGRAQTQVKVKLKIAEPRIHTIAQTEGKPFPVAFIFTTLLCSMLFLYMIYNLVRINEYTIDISSLNKKMSTLTAAQTELTLKLERKNDLVEIERVATQEYGMVKRDKVTKQYVNAGSGDVIETAPAKPDDETSPDGLSSLMSAISRNFGDLIK